MHRETNYIIILWCMGKEVLCDGVSQTTLQWLPSLSVWWVVMITFWPWQKDVLPHLICADDAGVEMEDIFVFCNVITEIRYLLLQINLFSIPVVVIGRVVTGGWLVEK